jgi:RDD family
MALLRRHGELCEPGDAGKDGVLPDRYRYRGARISFGRATERYFAKILSALTLGIGYLMVGWTKQKRGLHDFIAGTLVTRR